MRADPQRTHPTADSSPAASPRVRAWRSGLVLAVLLAGIVLSLACGQAQISSVEERTIENSARKVRYVVPPDWLRYGDEIRSRKGTMFTVEVFSLVGADREFVKALPDSLVLLLEQRTRNFFRIVGAPSKRQTMVAGEPAFEVSFPVQAREGDEPFRILYWIVRVGDLLYALRLTYPPGGEAVDAPAAQELLESVRFL